MYLRTIVVCVPVCDLQCVVVLCCIYEMWLTFNVAPFVCVFLFLYAVKRAKFAGPSGESLSRSLLLFCALGFDVIVFLSLFTVSLPFSLHNSPLSFSSHRHSGNNFDWLDGTSSSSSSGSGGGMPTAMAMAVQTRHLMWKFAFGLSLLFLSRFKKLFWNIQSINHSEKTLSLKKMKKTLVVKY